MSEGDYEIQTYSCKIHTGIKCTVGNIVNNYVISLYGDIS